MFKWIFGQNKFFVAVVLTKLN